MKKSTFFIIAAILTWLAGITAANLKLRSEYLEQHILPSYKTLMLPPFRHIVVVTPPAINHPTKYMGEIEQSDSNCIEYNFYQPLSELGTFYVRNDTLYMEGGPNRLETIKNLKIRCRILSSLQLENSILFVKKFKIDSLNLSLVKNADITLNGCTIETLKSTAKDDATITLFSTTVTDSASLIFKDVSTLSLYNSTITKRHLQMEFGTRLITSGSNHYDTSKRQ